VTELLVFKLMMPRKNEAALSLILPASAKTETTGLLDEAPHP